MEPPAIPGRFSRGADVEGDGEAERYEEDRAEKRVRDSVGAVFDDPDQIRVRDLFFEEETSQIGAEDHVETDGFSEETRADCRHQNEGKALAALGAEGQ